MFYVYVWYIENTNEVFYIGKGCNDRYTCLKTTERNHIFWEYYNNNSCKSVIVRFFKLEDDAYTFERFLISKYKEIGEARANIHEGGKGGNTLKYASEDTINQFKEKMTEINSVRCKSSKFKEDTSLRMKTFYKDKHNRDLQSKRLKKAWDNVSLRDKQSEKIIKSYTPELREVRAEARRKKICCELNSEVLYFHSRLELLAYLKDKYSFTPSNKTLASLLKGNSYIAYHKKFKHLNGLKIYYV